MQRLTFCLLIIFGLVFGGCENNTEDTNTPGSGGPYTVTFATFTSGTIPSQTVTKGGKVSTVNPPTATNATFGGWYKNGGIDTWDFSTDVVTGNITLCAGWEFTSIDGVTTFLGSATAAEEPSAARHTTQGVDPNPGKLPIPVGVNIQLTRQNWANLVKGIESKNKKVSLDLTNSTAGTGTMPTGENEPLEGGLWADGTFNPLDAVTGYLPNPGTGRVNNTIVGLVLPTAATKLYQATTNLNLLKEIRGDEVIEISSGPTTSAWSFHGGLMAKVYFRKLTAIADALTETNYLEVAYLPKVTTIADGAFMFTWIGGAPGVYDVDISSATSIGDKAFAQCGPGNLTITLGSTPPSLGTQIFEGVTGTKLVTVRVPNAAKSAYTNVWVEGLKGKGWTSAGVGSGSLMRNINVTIKGY